MSVYIFKEPLQPAHVQVPNGVRNLHIQIPGVVADTYTLYDGYSNFTSIVNSTLELGFRFKVLQACQATALRVYVKNTGGTPATFTANLWNHNTEALLGSVILSNPGTSDTWVEAALATEVNLDADTEYVVSYGYTGGHGYVNPQAAGLGNVYIEPVGPNPGTDDRYGRTGGVVGVFPSNTSGSGSGYGVDVIVT